MQIYTKINTLYKRFQNLGKEQLPNPEWKKFQNIIYKGSYSKPCFEYLKDNLWECYSKIDGTNSKIAYYPSTGEIKVGGKTDNANSQSGQFEFLQAIAERILPQLKEMYPPECAVFTPVMNPKTSRPFYYLEDELVDKPTKEAKYTLKYEEAPIYIYGEYYGKGIQKVGGKYRDDNDFVVFDICQQGWYLPSKMRNDICTKLGLTQVPYLGIMTLSDAEKIVTEGFKTRLQAKDQTLLEEGIVARPTTPIKDEHGNRIIVKIKTCDYAKLKDVRHQFSDDEYNKFVNWYVENVENKLE